MEIPAVGIFFVKNNLAAVQFHDSIMDGCRDVTKRPLSERKQRGEMKLNS